MSPQTLQLVIPVAVIAVIFLLRARRVGKPQPLKLGLLWVRPALLVFACAMVLFLPARPGAAPIQLMPMDWPILGAGAVLGAIGGWHLGKTMAIEVHPENGTLMVTTSPIGLIVLVALLALRTAVRSEAGAFAADWPVNPAVIVDALIVFSAALFTVRSLEMYLRAKKVMAESGRG
jgi:drug/metabolite transporter (DMT)-like permease